MPKSGYSVSAYLKAQEKASSASASIRSSNPVWTKKLLVKIPFVRTMNNSRKAVNRVREFRVGYGVFEELHEALKDMPVGSKHTIVRTSEKGIVRKYVYRKITKDEYKLVSRSPRGSK